MSFTINAIDKTGSLASIATEDPREALQSLLAFEAANFRPVWANDAKGRLLLESDLIELTKQIEHSARV